MTTVNAIARAVAEVTGVTVEQILSHRRNRRVVRARHMAWSLTADLMDVNQKETGDLWGRHWTVIEYGCEKARRYYQSDTAFQKQYVSAKVVARELMKTPREEHGPERIIAEMVRRYEHKLRMMAQARPQVFMERYGNTVTA